MNTKYTVAAGLAKKKNSKAGRGSLLKGYTVGSLAPPGSVSSGNIAKFGYGIDNRFGRPFARGKVVPTAIASSSSSWPAPTTKSVDTENFGAILGVAGALLVAAGAA